MLCDFAQEKRIYRKGLTQAFDKKKMPISSLFGSGKTRNIA